MISAAYCNPHRTRLRTLVPAEYVVCGENFCAACFKGEPLFPQFVQGGKKSIASAVLPRSLNPSTTSTPIQSTGTAPAASAPRPSGQLAKSRHKHLNREQLISLLTEARARRERDWVLFLVTYWHGLRASEAVSLTPENLANGSLIVHRLGGSLRTVQPLVVDENEILNESAAVEMQLRRHRETHSDDGQGRPLFPVSRVHFFRLMRLYGRLAGLPQHLCHPHVLKRSIGLRALCEAGMENARRHLGYRASDSMLSVMLG